MKPLWSASKRSKAVTTRTGTREEPSYRELTREEPRCNELRLEMQSGRTEVRLRLGSKEVWPAAHVHGAVAVAAAAHE